MAARSPTMWRSSARLMMSRTSARIAQRQLAARSLSSQAVESEQVLISKPPGMRVVDLNRPQALNSLNVEMVNALLPLFQDWQHTGPDVKLVALRGTGARAFCAGGDIRFLHECASTGTAEGRQPAYDFFRSEYTMNHVIATSRVPIVSILEGIVMGGGVGLSVHGQFRIATEHTIFAMPETGIGFFPDVGGTFFLPRLAGGGPEGGLGLYLGLTGARLKGRDVVTAGVATHFVPQDRVEMLEAVLLEFAQATQGKAYTLESNQDRVDEEALSAAIRSIDRLADEMPSEGEAEDSGRPLLDEASLAEIDETFGRASSVDEILSTVSALAAEATARGEAEHWAVGAAKELSRASPTSLRVTFAALQRGAQCASLAECLKMEFRIAQRFMRHPDFVAGVGAVLQRETTRPSWDAPPSSADELEEWFEEGEDADLELEVDS